MEAMKLELINWGLITEKSMEYLKMTVGMLEEVDEHVKNDTRKDFVDLCDRSLEELEVGILSAQETQKITTNLIGILGQQLSGEPVIVSEIRDILKSNEKKIFELMKLNLEITAEVLEMRETAQNLVKNNSSIVLSAATEHTKKREKCNIM